MRVAIATAARERHVMVNLVDDIPDSGWAMPSVVRRGELVLAIGTGGAAPALSKKLRIQLEDEFGPEWAEVLRVLRDVREATLGALPDLGERAARWAAALDLAEAAELIREGRGEELRTRLSERLLTGVRAP